MKQLYSSLRTYLILMYKLIYPTIHLHPHHIIYVTLQTVMNTRRHNYKLLYGTCEFLSPFLISCMTPVWNFLTNVCFNVNRL